MNCITLIINTPSNLKDLIQGYLTSTPTKRKERKGTSNNKSQTNLPSRMKSNDMNICTFSILMALVVLLAQQDISAARESKQRRHHHASRQMGSETYNSYPSSGETIGTSLQDRRTSTIFNVLDFGAKGDGSTDDTKAFEAAWLAACKLEASTMVVPSGSIFLVKPISFSGPNCESNIVFQLDGKIIAPTNPESWGSGLLQWLEFTKLNGITVRGNGIIDGQGSVWWSYSPTHKTTQESNYLVSTKSGGRMPSTKPTALRFYGSSDVTVTGITIQNSPRTHLKFDNCQSVQVFDVTVSSPGETQNTDGIHLQNSQDVTIHSSKLACGDDCVSIQTGCSGINIENVNCGPGHGISIGGLGEGNTKACVSNITVRDSRIQNTLTGVRIKTWQGGSGSVQGVRFENIQISDVEIPIMIDQYYCQESKCQNKTSAVAVSGISYQNIKGTYTLRPVHFACSDSFPCTDITLATIQLTPQQEKNHLSEPFCWKTYGELRTSTTPPIECLMMAKSRGKQVQNKYESCQT